MKDFDQCADVANLFDEETNSYSLLRRVKLFHRLCQNHPEFSCLCEADGYANCFPFYFNKTSTCPGRTTCKNDGECLLDHSICPSSAICICRECFFGGRCQFTTKTSSLSLDVILGYQIRPYLTIHQQQISVKVSIVITTLMLVIGLVNSILSIITFRLKKLGDGGVRLYLLLLSIVSLIFTMVFVFKFWLLVLTQMALITNQKIIQINCILMEYIVRSLVATGDWLSACVAIERMLVVIKGVNFDQTKSKQKARWIIITHRL